MHIAMRINSSVALLFWRWYPRSVMEKEYIIKAENEEMDMSNFESLNTIEGFIIKNQNKASQPKLTIMGNNNCV